MRKKIIAGLISWIFAAMILSASAGEKKMSDYLPKEKNGAAIQAAIDAAHAAGGGRVVLEPGVYLSGTIYLKSNVELHLPAGSKILGYDTPDKYDDICDSALVNIAPERSRKVLLAALHAENIAVTGQARSTVRDRSSTTRTCRRTNSSPSRRIPGRAWSSSSTAATSVSRVSRSWIRPDGLSSCSTAKM